MLFVVFPLLLLIFGFLCLIFVNLINMCLGVFHLGFTLFGTLWVSWTWMAISFPILGKFSTIISLNIFSWSFFLSGTPMIEKMQEKFNKDLEEIKKSQTTMGTMQ